MNLILWGLSLNFFGSSLLIFVSIFGKRHQIDYSRPWHSRYWWMRRRPFWKNTITHKWHFKWNHIVIVNGPIPPKHLLNSFGFLLISLGFVFQIIELIY